MRAALQGAKDPVCGMTIEPGHAAARAAHEGKTYYFCSRSCKDEFDKNRSGKS
jgi:Cu+-exporting ATPase